MKWAMFLFGKISKIILLKLGLSNHLTSTEFNFIIRIGYNKEWLKKLQISHKIKSMTSTPFSNYALIIGIASSLQGIILLCCLEEILLVGRQFTLGKLFSTQERNSSKPMKVGTSLNNVK
jgi:hypothetical protein